MAAHTICLVGNPNCGKTTLFNALTGARQQVGNWPGVTVERKTGSYQGGGGEVAVVDLPGVYSLAVSSVSSLDERIAREFVLSGQADLVVNILDASNLERNLYLTTQLLEMRVPMLVALNMVDVARSRRIRIDVVALAARLGCPVVPIVASRGDGVPHLRAAIDRSAGARRPAKIDLGYRPEVEHALAELAPMLEGVTLSPPADVQWLALKLLEGDEGALAMVPDRIRRVAGRIARQAGDRADEDCDILIADSRYGFANALIREAVRREGVVRRTVSDRVDRRGATPTGRHSDLSRGDVSAVSVHHQLRQRLHRLLRPVRRRAAGRRHGPRARRHRQPAVAYGAAGRRRRRRRADGGHLHPDHRLPLPVPLGARGFRLHGARRLRHGSADAERRPAGQVVHPADRRFRLQRSGDHGDANSGEPARPHHDGDDGAVHVVRRPAAGVRAVRRGDVSDRRAEPGVRPLSHRHRLRGDDRAGAEEDAAEGRDDALRHGTTALPLADDAGDPIAHLGAVAGVPVSGRPGDRGGRRSAELLQQLGDRRLVRQPRHRSLGARRRREVDHPRPGAYGHRRGQLAGDGRHAHRHLRQGNRGRNAERAVRLTGRGHRRRAAKAHRSTCGAASGQRSPPSPPTSPSWRIACSTRSG